MFENALTLKNMSYGKKITCKAVVSAGLVALAVILPQLVHLALGAPVLKSLYEATVYESQLS